MSNQSSKLLFRGGAYATEFGLAALLGMAIMVFAARGSSLEAFGNFAFVLALASLQQPLAVFGLTTLFYGRAASRSARSSRLLWSALLISFAIGAGLYAATLAVLAGLGRMDFANLYAFAGLRVMSFCPITGSPRAGCACITWLAPTQYWPRSHRTSIAAPIGC